MGNHGREETEDKWNTSCQDNRRNLESLNSNGSRGKKISEPLLSKNQGKLKIFFHPKKKIIKERWKQIKKKKIQGMKGLISNKSIKEKKNIKNTKIFKKTIGLKKKTSLKENNGLKKRRENGIDKKKMKEGGWNNNKKKNSNKNKDNKEKEDRSIDK